MPADRNVAIGRPVESRTGYAAQMTLYPDSSKKPCALCGSPAWFGPRLTELIDAGAIAACGDCMVEAMAAGVRPAGFVSLGNPYRRGRDAG